MSGAADRRDASDQVEEANRQARDEIASQRRADAHLIADEGPTAAELEADDFADWSWWRQLEDRPDPWGHLPTPAPRQHAAIPTDPPF